MKFAVPKFSFVAAVLLAAGACAISDAQAPPARPDSLALEDDSGLVRDGRQLVIRECASCHAIDQSTTSPRADAPPMRNILDRYDPETLADNLIEGIRIGHDDMPLFDLNVIGADALIAYLKSIAQTPPASATGRAS